MPPRGARQKEEGMSVITMIQLENRDENEEVEKVIICGGGPSSVSIFP